MGRLDDEFESMFNEERLPVSELWIPEPDEDAEEADNPIDDKEIIKQDVGR